MKQALELSAPFIVPVNPGIQDNGHVMSRQEAGLS